MCGDALLRHDVVSGIEHERICALYFACEKNRRVEVCLRYYQTRSALLRPLTIQSYILLGDWLGFTGTNLVLEGQSDSADKVPWKLVLVNGTNDTYHLQNLWGGVHERRYGMWAGPSGSGMADQQMTLVAKDDLGNRGTYKFMETSAPRPAPKNWAYCSSAKGVPEQINIQVASADRW
jgi:hypothetical protein